MATKKKSIIPGFSLRHLLGITSARQKIARKTGIPTTKQGRKNKLRRKLLPFLCVAVCLMSFAPAVAEGITPRMFLAGCGLTVYDQDQLAAMSSSGEGLDLSEVGCTLAILSWNDTGMPSIVYYDGECSYAAMNMLSLFGGQEQDPHAFDRVYADFCDAYDFEYYGYGDGDEAMACVTETDTLEKMFAAYEDAGNLDGIPAELYHDKAEFTAAIRAASGK